MNTEYDAFCSYDAYGACLPKLESKMYGTTAPVHFLESDLTASNGFFPRTISSVCLSRMMSPSNNSKRKQCQLFAFPRIIQDNSVQLIFERRIILL